MHIVEKHKPFEDQSMKKIIENYLILKPKVERIGGPDDFKELVSGNKILQKYGGVKQQIAKQQVQQKRQEERQKRSFVDKGITVMTVDGERSFTINAAQIYKAEMNAQKTNKHKRWFNLLSPLRIKVNC